MSNEQGKQATDFSESALIASWLDPILAVHQVAKCGKTYMDS